MQCFIGDGIAVRYSVSVRLGIRQRKVRLYGCAREQCPDNVV